MSKNEYVMDSVGKCSARMIIFVVMFFSAQLCVGQNDFSSNLNSRFTAFNRENFQEKLFVHTDRSLYIAGEIIWFKIYSVDASLNQPLDLSKVSYIEILDKNHGQILKAKINMKNGSGNGSFFLPLTLNSGTYTLRAYTNWMKNFSADFYFEKTIRVFNTLKAPVKSVGQDSSSYDIQFFPESGSLVEGVKSKVGFRVAGRNGKGLDCSGVIVNQENKEVASFQTLQFGLGHFYFTPSANEKYQALIKMDADSVVSIPLPEILKRGYVMQLTDSGKNLVKVKINSDAQTDDRIISLFVHTRQITKAQKSGRLNNHEAEFVIDKNLLGEGISHFTLFDDKQQPVCERLLYKRPSSLDIGITSLNSQYLSRKKVDVDVVTKDPLKKHVASDLSVSVFMVDSLQTMESENILNYLWLSSDLKGKIESPDFYFKDSSDRTNEAMDNLLLTHGWSRFRWNDVLLSESKKKEFIPEYEGHLVAGKLTDNSSGLPVENIPAYFSVKEKQFFFNTTSSNKEGKLYLNMHDFFGNEEIIVQTKNEISNSYKIEIENPFSDKFSTRSVPSIEYDSESDNSLLTQSISTQVQNAYYYDKTRNFYSPYSDSLVFYGPPDHTYLLDDYTRFTSMEEILREYVQEVGVRTAEGKKNLYVWKDDKNSIKGSPLVLLDGVPYFSVDSVLKFDPLKIKKLEIMKRRYYLGQAVYDGIVSFRTYNGDLGGTPLDSNAVIHEYEGLQLEREFFSPVYETASDVKSRLPDFRTTLYWSSEILSDSPGHQKLSFYTSDQPGNYVLVVQGLSQNGLAGAKAIKFEVK